MQQMKCELIEVDGSYNVRDLGGYIGEGGRPLNKRRFLRAGSLSGLTDKGKGQISALCDCVIDLRSSLEVELHPDALPEGVRHCHIPMLDYIQSNFVTGDFTTFPKSMTEMYVGIIDRAQTELREVFRLLADPDCGRVLFHCTAGKDRTGIVAMLVLLLAGVDRQDVEEDYSWSDKLIAPIMMPPDENFQMPKYLFASDAATMRAAIDHLNEVYGGVVGYLDKIGVTKEEQQTVKDRLLK